jgi:hypothetical protein
MTHKTAYLAAFTLILSIPHCPHTAYAQSASASAAGVAGSWKVSLHGQHIIPVGMELKQDGRKVTGTLMLWNGDVALDGDLVDGTMKVSGRLEPTDGTPAGDRVVTATLLANGTLEGTFGGDHGQIKLTAERFTDRPTRRAATAPTVPPAVAPPNAPAMTDPAPFAGRWRLTVGDGANARAMELEIVVDGSAINGTLKSDHAGPLAIQNGRFADGTLTFGVPMGAGATVDFAATLKGHGALAGNISGAMGQMTFTGERAR